MRVQIGETACSTGDYEGAAIPHARAQAVRVGPFFEALAETPTDHQTVGPHPRGVMHAASGCVTLTCNIRLNAQLTMNLAWTGPDVEVDHRTDSPHSLTHPTHKHPPPTHPSQCIPLCLPRRAQDLDMPPEPPPTLLCNHVKIARG